MLMSIFQVSHLPDDSWCHQDVGWNTSVVGFTITMQRESFKYVALYFLPTGKVSSFHFSDSDKIAFTRMDGPTISRNVRSDFFDEFPDSSDRLPRQMWPPHHHTSGANSFCHLCR